tara:strand:- start:1567 stop:1974 length:408 start_codon:yes stop_codon:yes gene_type:complete
MRLREPFQIRQAIDLQVNHGVKHKLNFHLAGSEYHIQLLDKSGDLICTGRGHNESEAWKDAISLYEKAPKRKTKDELARENENLRRKVADIQPDLEDDTHEANAKKAASSSDATESDVEAPLRPRRGRKKNTPSV